MSAAKLTEAQRAILATVQNMPHVAHHIDSVRKVGGLVSVKSRAGCDAYWLTLTDAGRAALRGASMSAAKLTEAQRKELSAIGPAGVIHWRSLLPGVRDQLVALDYIRPRGPHHYTITDAGRAAMKEGDQ